MIIIDKSTIGYKIPEEFQYAVDFEKEHPDWKRSDTTQMISFTHEGYYDIPLKKKEADDESIPSAG